jgi:hypothetical protein
MANPWRGEVPLEINGERHVMKLTLGALAELEAELETGSLLSLVERFESAAYSSRDVLALLAAGLKGGGCTVSRDDLIHGDIAGGPIAAAKAAAELLARAFVLPERQ